MMNGSVELMGDAIKFLFFALAACLPMVQRHAQESSTLGGHHHAQGELHARGGGQLTVEQQNHIAQGGAVCWGEQHTEREQYAQGRETCSGSSMLGGAA